MLFIINFKSSRRPSGAEKGGEAEGPSALPKFSVDVPFFADGSFKCALFERSNEKCTRKSTSKITSKIK